MTTFEDIFSSISGGRILDVATGNGNFIQTLDATLKVYDEIIGIDTSDRFASVFEDAFVDKPIRYMQMDAAQLDFPDASFDTVCIANSLHHLADPPRILADMLHVLKPGGRLIISEMYCDGQRETQLTHVHLHHWWAAIDTAQGISHNGTYPRQKLIDIAQSLKLANWHFHDIAYLEDDPKTPEILQQLDNAIDHYLQKAEGLPNQKILQKRGEVLRQRMQEIGLHGASTLVAIGIK